MLVVEITTCIAGSTAVILMPYVAQGNNTLWDGDMIIVRADGLRGLASGASDVRRSSGLRARF
jgi:hypothetical protein